MRDILWENDRPKNIPKLRERQFLTNLFALQKHSNNIIGSLWWMIHGFIWLNDCRNLGYVHDAEKCFDVVSPNKCLINGQFWENVTGLLITWSACWVKTWPMNQRSNKRGDSRSGSGPHMKCSNAEISLISDGGRFFLRKGKIYSMQCMPFHIGAL